MKEIIREPKLIFFFQNPGTITKLIYHSWYKNKCCRANLIMERISLEQEIETNIPGSNDWFSNTRYLRLIENQSNVSIIQMKEIICEPKMIFFFKILEL